MRDNVKPVQQDAASGRSHGAVGPSDATIKNNGSSGVRSGSLRCVDAGNSLLLPTLQLAIQEGGCLLIEDIESSVDPILDPVLCHGTYTKVGNNNGN